MFTGIVERTGRVVSMETSPEQQNAAMPAITQLIIDAGKNFETNLGDSVAVDGCCLTVTSNKMQLLAFDVSRETLQCTSLNKLREGDEVNLERALKLGERLGGHIVTGHVDTVAEVVKLRKQADGWGVFFTVAKEFGRLLISKGSVCLDGVSLTVNTVEDASEETVFSCMLIPTTISLTSFKHLSEGHIVNVEMDMIGKYVERLLPFNRL